jgi:hypothetical protein
MSDIGWSLGVEGVLPDQPNTGLMASLRDPPPFSHEFFIGILDRFISNAQVAFELLCGRPHKPSCVAKLVMWRPGDFIRRFSHSQGIERHITFSA